jgi:23S rRNA pseudouridine2605 synthase
VRPEIRGLVLAPRSKGKVSLARALSKFGVCSRKEAARLIEAGRVQVKGKVARLPALRIDPRHDPVTVDGRRVGDDTERIVIALHKPKGYITSRTDPAGRATVYALLKDLPSWVFPVGRLDRDSAGLLVLTNDHRLGERLTDPRHHVARRYHVLVESAPSAEALSALRAGADIGEPAPTRPARVRVLGSCPGGRTWLEITLTEGRNRQVRRMCATVGHDVVELVRVAIGGLTLGDLGLGQWRRLAPSEVTRLPGRSRS